MWRKEGREGMIVSPSLCGCLMCDMSVIDKIHTAVRCMRVSALHPLYSSVLLILHSPINRFLISVVLLRFIHFSIWTYTVLQYALPPSHSLCLYLPPPRAHLLCNLPMPSHGHLFSFSRWLTHQLFFTHTLSLPLTDTRTHTHTHTQTTVFSLTLSPLHLLTHPLTPCLYLSNNTCTFIGLKSFRECGKSGYTLEWPKENIVRFNNNQRKTWCLENHRNLVTG